MKGIIGKKVGMTSVFDNGKYVAVSVVEAGPCVITQIKTVETDGYYATQLSFDEKKEKQTQTAERNANSPRTQNGPEKRLASPSYFITSHHRNVITLDIYAIL